MEYKYCLGRVFCNTGSRSSCSLVAPVIENRSFGPLSSGRITHHTSSPPPKPLRYFSNYSMFSLVFFRYNNSSASRNYQSTGKCRKPFCNTIESMNSAASNNATKKIEGNHRRIIDLRCSSTGLSIIYDACKIQVFLRTPRPHVCIFGHGTNMVALHGSGNACGAPISSGFGGLALQRK